MALRIYDTLVPQGDYPAVKAEDVQMPDGTKLSDLEIPEMPEIPEPIKDYVKTVNGKAPDENGNVEVEIPEDSGGVSSWKNLTDKPFGEEDNREILFQEQEVEGFALIDPYGMLGKSISPAPFAPVIGETYSILWDEQEYSCQAIDASTAMPGIVAMGNGSAFGFPGNNEPFIIAVSELDISFFVTDLNDQKQMHRIGICQGGIEVKTLDAKYLPMKAIDERIDAYISAALEGDY